MASENVFLVGKKKKSNPHKKAIFKPEMNFFLMQLKGIDCHS